MRQAMSLTVVDVLFIARGFLQNMACWASLLVESIFRCYVELGIMWSRFCTFQWVRCDATELLNIIAGGSISPHRDGASIS
jgi:hypothetical protein